MARESAKILTGIWGNPDIRALTLEQQGLYLQIWTHPGLSYAGVLDWNPARIAQLSSGSSAARVAELGAEIEATLLFVIDHETGELLLRPWLRHDGILKQPKMATSLANAYAATASNILRGVIVHGLRRLQVEEPTLAAWKADSVKAILKHPAIDARTIQGNALGVGPGVVMGERTPSVTGVLPGVALPINAGVVSGESSGVLLLPPTTTATTTSTYVDKDMSDDVEQPTSNEQPKDPYSTQFSEWWKSYPRKESKGDAWKAWETARRSKTLPSLDVLVAATAAYVAATKDPTFLKLPGGWLRDRKWEDEKPSSPVVDLWANRERFGGADGPR